MIGLHIGYLGCWVVVVGLYFVVGDRCHCYFVMVEVYGCYVLFVGVD